MSEGAALEIMSAMRVLNSYDFPVFIGGIGEQAVTSIFDGRSAETRVRGYPEQDDDDECCGEY